MRSTYNNILALLIGCLVMANVWAGCSDNPVSHNTKELAIKVTGEGLEVFNKKSEPIYYFGVDQEAAAVIFWAPMSTSENEIKPMSKKSIPFSDIAGYKENGAIIFNFWTSDDPSTEVEVKNVVVEPAG